MRFGMRKNLTMDSFGCASRMSSMGSPVLNSFPVAESSSSLFFIKFEYRLSFFSSFCAKACRSSRARRRKKGMKAKVLTKQETKKARVPLLNYAFVLRNLFSFNFLACPYFAYIAFRDSLSARAPGFGARLAHRVDATTKARLAYSREKFQCVASTP